MGYTKFVSFKEWCFTKGYASKEMMDSIKRENQTNIEEYQKNKQEFYKAMFKHSDEYSDFIGKQIELEMKMNETDSLIYEALLYMLDEYAPISKH